ncbi:MAG: hypothetical protein NTZ05_12300 [Chloroflexi bacterium]|nr:hypothetical protein [Chloroflexota bacterium]
MSKGFVDKDAQQTVYGCLTGDPRGEKEIVECSGYDLAFTRAVLKNLVRSGMALDVSQPAPGSTPKKPKLIPLYVRGK